jgi:hypothetical protein
MNTSDRFLRFAAECEVTAEFAQSAESRAIWSGMAQRWFRCAELVKQQESNVHRASLVRRKRTPSHSFAH